MIKKTKEEIKGEIRLKKKTEDWLKIIKNHSCIHERVKKLSKNLKLNHDYIYQLSKLSLNKTKT